MLRGMTQKALGVAVGFPESSADVRIAQYESGARTPKRELLCQLAAPLGVSPSQLTVPRIKNSEELCSLLAALEDECGIELSPRSENAKAIYQSYWKGATDIENL
jgi:transcriptional regulator with XRE-family HTH domain